MRSWRNIIHIGLCNSPVHDPLLKEPNRLTCGSYILLSDILQINSLWLVLSYLHVSLWYIKQILYFLQVNLNHRYLDPELDVWRLLADFAEHVGYDSWKDALFGIVVVVWADACVRFSWRGLAIGENCPVESFKCALYNVFTNLFVDLLLSWLFIENTIESEFVLWLFVFNSNCFLW